MLDEIDKIALEYASIWQCPKPVRVFLKLEPYCVGGIYETKHKHIRYTRTSIIIVSPSVQEFQVPETSPIICDHDKHNYDYEFATKVTFVGVYDSDFKAIFCSFASPIYVFTDRFATKNGFLVKNIMYNTQLSPGYPFICKITGFIGKITFLYSQIRLKDLQSIMFHAYSRLYINSWKYIVAEKHQSCIFTEAQLDEMWSYEYPYMKRPKNIMLLYLTPHTKKRIKYSSTLLTTSKYLKDLKIIHIETVNGVNYTDNFMRKRYC